ncbi:Uncharacterised protein [Mycobacteroides abscessus subsp. abscessus]|nr:Uncharacterised protein [Mycobacteroides abscessus subsp. abscessus]
MPSIIAPRSTPSATSARCARRIRFSLNCGVALAMASTPVNAAQPLENALSTSKIPMVPTVWESTCGTLWLPPLTRPTTITDAMLTTNTTVGVTKALALLTIPRRLTAVIKASTESAIQTVYRPAAGKAEVSAAVPAVTDTATLRT